jgi:hypothetical protein
MTDKEKATEVQYPAAFVKAGRTMSEYCPYSVGSSATTRLEYKMLLSDVTLEGPRVVPTLAIC